MPKKDTMKAEAKRAIDQGVEAAASGAETLRDSAKAELETRAENVKSSIAEKVDAEAERLGNAADQMHEEAPHTQAVKRLANETHRTAETIRATDAPQVAHDLATAMRNNPLAAVTLSALAGFAIGRFAKSSARPVQELSSPDLSLHHIPEPEYGAVS